MNIDELNAIEYLLKTNKYKLFYKMIDEDKVPNEYREGYKKYYKFQILDNKKDEVTSVFVPYGPIPSKLEEFFTKKHGNILYYDSN